MSVEITVPYENASSGEAARAEINKLLRRMGCDQIGWMDKHAERKVLLTFVHKGVGMTLEASADGWAAMFLKAKPWTTSRRTNKPTYELRAREQGLIAVNSILRDWVKGQITAIECGMMTFEEAFLPVALLSDGRRVSSLLAEQTRRLAPPNS